MLARGAAEPGRDVGGLRSAPLLNGARLAFLAAFIYWARHGARPCGEVAERLCVGLQNPSKRVRLPPSPFQSRIRRPRAPDAVAARLRSPATACRLSCGATWRACRYCAGRTSPGGAGLQDVGGRCERLPANLTIYRHADSVHRARAAVDKAKRELFGCKGPPKWDLHGYEIWKGAGFQKTCTCLAATKNRNVHTARAIEKSGATLVSVIISKNRPPSGRHNLPNLSWSLITGRFEHYMACRGRGDRGEITATLAPAARRTGLDACYKKSLRG